MPHPVLPGMYVSEGQLLAEGCGNGGRRAIRDVHLHVNGAFHGSLSDLARDLRPELARLDSLA